MKTLIQPALADTEIDVLLRTGLYQSRDEIISEAMDKDIARFFGSEQ